LPVVFLIFLGLQLEITEFLFPFLAEHLDFLSQGLVSKHKLIEFLLEILTLLLKSPSSHGGFLIELLVFFFEPFIFGRNLVL